MEPKETLLAKRSSSATEIDIESIEFSSEYQTKTSQIQKQSSLNHNMVKQLIITIKQMMAHSIAHISTGEINKALQEIWYIFVQNRQANKEMLKALFDDSTNMKLLEKYGLKKVVDSFGMDIFKEAIQALKEEILFRMKN